MTCDRAKIATAQDLVDAFHREMAARGLRYRASVVSSAPRG